MQFDIEKIIEKAEVQGHLTVMAFDFGTQKMGMAVGEKSITSGYALALFPMKDGIPNWENLSNIIAEWQPELLLVGLPLNMDGSESELTLRAKKFARRLRHHTHIATFMLDERLSSREARNRQQHTQGNYKKIATDSLVACLLLDQWYSSPSAVSQP